MNDSACQQLDDYLAGELHGDEHGEFVSHLHQCAACRDEVAAQRRIDQLLREANRHVELLPGFDLLVERRVRRSVLLRSAVWAASAALLLLAALAAGWLIPAADLGREPNQVQGRIVTSPPRESPGGTGGLSTRVVPPSKETPAGEPPPRVVVRTDNNTIALRVESANPTVHIYRLLPVEPLAARPVSKTSSPNETISPSPSTGNDL